MSNNNYDFHSNYSNLLHLNRFAFLNQFFSQLLKSKILNCWFSIFHQFEKTSRPRVWDKIGKSKKYEGFYSGFL